MQNRCLKNKSAHIHPFEELGNKINDTELVSCRPWDSILSPTQVWADLAEKGEGQVLVLTFPQLKERYLERNASFKGMRGKLMNVKREHGS